ncbi:elongation factor P maturation arginine rhamnosyltransferase EarP [Simiduia agarivorans]|uniref:Protein-arginine rhamnosyltransferase n=1 Tax=Simiduia agarivorans (strain DSM 21679 / JCM 13881 / BCRC 17597 / SA1) TaxID=1117647 RepID=K4KQ33_SIMAS|nr:elongation factor P maturation arginine rhamnosyltransferase EarP [Simiduia agarivorans]AFV00214.1 hypothetical protein M5M_15405 [Simiduia agarivorans SA1 = DSM 21679]
MAPPLTPAYDMQHWHLFCKVIDNYGDIGVCWRLARQLVHQHRQQVTLFVDDLASFNALCPALDLSLTEQHCDGVCVRHWTQPLPPVTPADVVIEAFGCHLPANYITAMQIARPLWLNLEYLSAEEWVEDYHLNQSPVHGLRKTFFFPGFSANTGGLLWETALLDLADQANQPGWRAEFLQPLGLPVERAECLISLFAYENAALPDLLNNLRQSRQWVTLLVPKGRISRGVEHWLGEDLVPMQAIRRERLTVQELPFMAQPEYDRLLASCDVNFVRGEESFVRSQMLARPFVWHIYPQDADTHLIKLDAFLNAYLAQAPSPLAQACRQAHRAWNQPGAAPSQAFSQWLRQLPAAKAHASLWQQQQRSNGDLASNIVQFCTNTV